MIRTNLKVALRNLLRARSYTFINVGGLSAGLACAIIIFLYIRHELTYDRYQPHPDRTYRLSSFYINHGEIERSARSSPSIPGLLQQEFPDMIETQCRLWVMHRLRLQGSHGAGTLDHVCLADPSATDIFHVKFLLGDSATALSRPHSIVLTKSVALRFFGLKNPIGDTLLGHNQYKYIVTGVIDDLPENTHHRFSALLAYDTYGKRTPLTSREHKANLWLIRDYVFLRFAPGYGPRDFYERFPAFFAKHMRIHDERLHETYFPLLEPLRTTHMNPHRLAFEHFKTGNPVYIYAFSVVGIFLLLLACINYMNMATARSTTRSREVGLRKVMGSGRPSLVLQFLGESLILSFVALLLALCLTEVVLTLTPFNALMGKNLRLDLIKDPAVGLWALLLTILLGTLSGLYPALFLSSFQPAEALRGRGLRGRAAMSLRKAMVVFQFTIAIGVIICTFLMRNQVEYMRDVDLGFQGETTLVIPVNDSITAGRIPLIRKQMETNPHVISTTTAYNVPGYNVGRMTMRLVRADTTYEQMMDVLEVGQDYIQAMGLELTQGHDFTPQSITDSTAEFIVNETAAALLWEGDPIGKQLIWGYDEGLYPEHKGPIIGIVKDFTVHSLHFQRRPLVLIPTPKPRGYVHVRMQADSITQTMQHILQVWAPNVANGSPFNGFFIDETFDRLYDTDQRHSQLMGILAYICMVISGLGLVGFASYSIAQRRKEIGIRKVMGASSLRILVWLLTDMLYLVVAASLAGSVLALIVFRIWLGEFAYHAEVPVGTFFFTGLAALLIALLTVGFHSIRASLEPPIHALRYE